MKTKVTNPESHGAIVCIPGEEQIKHQENHDSRIVDSDSVESTKLALVQNIHPNPKDQNSGHRNKNNFDDKNNNSFC